MAEPKEGDVKVIRADDRNFGVQQYTKIEVRSEMKKTGEIRYEWQTVGYYGERPEALICACKNALMIGATGTETKELIATIERAEKNIIASVKELFKESK